MEEPNTVTAQPQQLNEAVTSMTDVSKVGSTLLCSDCQNLFTTPKTFTVLKSKPGFHFTRSRKCTLRNAVDGCRLCQELLCIPYNDVSEYWEKVEREQGWNKQTSLEKSKGWPIELWKSELALLEPRGLKGKSAASDRDMHFSMKGEPEISPYTLTLTKHRRLWFSKKMYFEIAASADDPASEDVLNRVLNRAIDCDATYNEIRAGLQHCELQHLCQRKNGRIGGRFGPPFLVNVEAADGIVRLHRTGSNKYLRYVALSFAWGGSQVMTTKSNVDAHLDHIDVNTLPQSVQDAILVTRKLGLKYLWVDALYIIQDSEEDKLKQTPMLGKIFENAYVSIIANCAKTCSEGFLEEPGPRKRFEIPYCTESGTLGKVSLAAVEPRTPGTIYFQALQLRAWAYQETCLSGRLIVYNRHEVNWMCSNILAARPGVGGWTEHVRQVSRRAISDPCDRLPAISSLAQHYSIQMPESKYLAGIFSAETHHQLCWYVTTGQRLSRPQKWRAPSWSPFAVEGPIEQWHCWSDAIKIGPFLVDNNGEYHADFEILDSNVELLSEIAPFGRVVSGFIQVKGRLMRVNKDVLGSINSIGNILGGLALPMRDASRKLQRTGVIYFDTVNTFGDRIASADSIQSNHGPLSVDTELACLAICKKKVVVSNTDSHSNQTTYTIHRWDAGLVLAKLGNGDYHRVGHFLCNKKDVFPASQKLEVVRIV